MQGHVNDPLTIQQGCRAPALVLLVLQLQPVRRSMRVPPAWRDAAGAVRREGKARTEADGAFLSSLVSQLARQRRQRARASGF